MADPNFAAMYATRSRRVKTDHHDARTLCEACPVGAHRAAHRLSDAQRHVRAELAVRRRWSGGTVGGCRRASRTGSRCTMIATLSLEITAADQLIEPASPQQNARHERMHRILKAEATRLPKGSFRAQQRRFNTFRTEYNTERPHEALGNAPPITVYRPSPRPYPARLPAIEYPDHFLVRYVSLNGGIRLNRNYITLAPALMTERVGLNEVADGIWAVYFGTYLLGHLNERERRIHGAHNRTHANRHTT